MTEEKIKAMEEYKPMFPKKGEEISIYIDITPYLDKIIKKNYKLLEKLGD